MCGLAGFLGYGRLNAEDARCVATRMAQAIVHRGPNDEGVWIDAVAGIALAHRRLSILDLSSSGHQPMVSSNGRYIIAFNGEIYNHMALRSEMNDALLNQSWRGRSDTETLLAGFEAWGIEATLQRCIGMFAMAIWDRQQQMLMLARDRMGEKPLYYGWQGQGEHASFLFASELKAIKAHPRFKNSIDRGSLALFLRHNYVPAPYSIYENIQKLEPGCLLQISLKQTNPQITRYWSTLQVAIEGVRNPYIGSVLAATDALEVLLKSAVKQQMMADVPLGAFLSGGIDSSTVVALMQAQSAHPVKTFTIGFNEQQYNEAAHAKAVAKHLGTDHTELYVTPQQALNVIPQLPNFYCEPFADSSQIPTYLVAQLARQQVFVSLSGDAGDELFCGYNRYLFSKKLWNVLSKLPMHLRQLMRRVLTVVSPEHWNRAFHLVSKILNQQQKQMHWGDKLHKGAAVLASPTLEVLYRDLVSHWIDPAGVVIGGVEHVTQLTSSPSPLLALDPIQRMMAIDTVTYLPDDILVKLDRAAMAVSLEGRVPFLDHRIVEFAWSLPQNYKLHDGQSKWLLRQVLYRHVPKTLIERPKMGFAVPIGSWLRGPLRDWAENLLDDSRLRAEGFFNSEPIRQKWSEHLAGHRNWQMHLWSVLMFQSWLEQQL